MGIIKIKEESATPSNPPADFHKAYIKPDGCLYILDESGVESKLQTTKSFITKTGATYDIQSSDNKLLFDVNGSNMTAKLPDPTLNDGLVLILSVTNAQPNKALINQFDGITKLTELRKDADARTVVSNGVTWVII